MPIGRPPSDGSPLSVEIPDATRAAAIGPQAWATQALQATRRVLGG